MSSADHSSSSQTDGLSSSSGTNSEGHSVANGDDKVKKSLRHACKICRKTFLLRRYMTDHLRRRHQISVKRDSTLKEEELNKRVTPVNLDRNSEMFSCHICHEVFSEKLQLKDHLALHRGVICGVCGKTFSKRGHLNEHLEIHFADKSMIYKCRVCDKSFTIYRYLRSHYRRIHNLSVPTNCKKLLLEKTDHNGDSNTTCNPPKENLPNINPLLLTVGHTLKPHGSLASHQQQALQHSCGICTQLFQSEVILTTHYRNTHGLNVKDLLLRGDGFSIIQVDDSILALFTKL